MRIKSFTEVPEDVAGYGPLEDETGRRQFNLQLCGVAKGVLIARLPGIEDRDQAEALRGLRLYLPRSALPQPEAEEYYHADLIGLDAVLGDGTPVGRVRAIYDFGAGDTLELARDGAPPVLVPFTGQSCRSSRRRRGGSCSTRRRSGWGCWAMTSHDLARDRIDDLPGNATGPLAYSLAGKALKAGLWRLETVDIRRLCGR